MQPYGVQSMLKEGHKHLSGLEEAVLKNIDACKQLSVITRTSLGPNGNPFHFSYVVLTGTFLETFDQFAVHSIFLLSWENNWFLNRARFDRVMFVRIGCFLFIFIFMWFRNE